MSENTKIHPILTSGWGIPQIHKMEGDGHEVLTSLLVVPYASLLHHEVMTRPHLQLPVRWWSDHDQHAHRTLTLDPPTVAFLLVDCDGDAPGRYDQGVKTNVIAPALHAARSFGVRVVYLH